MPPRKQKPAPTDLNQVTRHHYRDRANRTELASFGRPMPTTAGADFFESLPNFLKAKDLREFAARVGEARRRNKPFHMLLGAHTIKVGLSPILIDLMQRDIVTGISFTGAAVIHDLELAFFGGTSEDVQSGLSEGSFGMVRETGELFAAVCKVAAEEHLGLGEAAGLYVNRGQAANRAASLFGMAHAERIPATVHVGIGTDIVAQHPNFDAAVVGAASHIDFRTLCAVCADIDDGGVLANIGSAVILPEVFLKALTVARNIRRKAGPLTTANFDMISHYRPAVNVVSRPTHQVGRGYDFVGHHEIMVPLLAWLLRLELERK